MNTEGSAWLQWDTHQPVRPTDLSRTPSLVHHPRQVNLKVSSTDAAVQIASSRLVIRINKNPWSLSIFDAAGSQIACETPILPNNPPDAARAMYGSLAFRLHIPERGLWRKYHHFSRRQLWFHAKAIASWQANEGGIQIAAETNDPFLRRLSVTIRFLDDVVFQFSARLSDTTSLTGFAHSYETPPDELFYGLGERFTACNQYGQEVSAWSSAGPTGRRDWTYFPQPFVITGSHYGILLDTSHRNRFHLCSDFRQRFAFETEGAELCYYFIYNPDPLEIIEGLTDLVGKPPLPPKWSFGVIRNINGGEENVCAEAHKLRAMSIPCSALWYYDSLDEDRHIAWPINPNFYDGDYSDIAALNRHLKTLGYKAQTYLFPYVYVGTKNYAEGAGKDYFVKNGYGDIYLIPFHTVDDKVPQPTTRMAAIIDFTHPAAVEWYQEIIRQIVLELDFDGWMHDFGEDVPADAVFFNDKTGAEMHNIYPVLYKKATYEACMRYKPEVSYYARAGYAGSQGYTMALWTGDQVINWSYDEGLPSVIPAALNLGFCGCPYIGPDIAGYFHSENHASIISEELWIRWLQLGALSPIMRDLIAYYPIELWSSEQTAAAYQIYSRLHMNLFPYLYSYAQVAHSRGFPIMRHLYLAYPDDVNVHKLDYQYLLGEELLIAPVLSPAVDEWQVYLPDGEWIGWWDGKRYPGKQSIVASAPLMQIPMFVKAAAIVPQLPADVDTLVAAPDESIRAATEEIDALVVDVFPSTRAAASEFRLWDGTVLRWDIRQNRFEIGGSSLTRTWTIRFRQFSAGRRIVLVSSDTPDVQVQESIDEDYQCLRLELTARDMILQLQTPQ